MDTRALGPYELVSPIGSGGLADVWSARHRADGRTVAIKFMRDGATDDDDMARAAFRDEIEAVASLDHPHIVRLLDFGDVPAHLAASFDGNVPAGSPYLVLEYVAGGSMDGAALPSDWGALQAALIALLSALAHSHARGLSHRDIKPANILLPDGPDPWRGLKLSDFGTAHQHRSTHVGDLERRFAGTLVWTAPEQVRGEWRDFGPWTDLYAFGCVAYMMTTGAPPFQAEHWAALMDLQLNHPPPPMQTRVAVPDKFEAWVGRLLAKSPSERFRSAADARAALLALSGTPPVLSASYPEQASSAPEGAGLALLISRRLPLVSRWVERAILWECLHATASERRARAVLIRGAATAGKTRLAQWLCETAHEEAGFDTVHLVHENPPGRRHGLGPMITRTLRLAGLDHDGAHARIASVLDLGRQGDWVAEGLTALVLGREQVAGDGAALGAAFVRALAARRPTILLVEDLHHGPDSLRFVTGLLSSPLASRLPLLIVVTVVEDAAHAADGWAAFVGREDVQTVTLAALSGDERGELLDAMLPLEPATRSRLVNVPAGPSPRLTRQVADWARAGELEAGPNGWRLRDLSVAPETESQFMAALGPASLLAEVHLDELACIEFAAILGDTVGLEEWAWCCRTAGSLSMPRALDTLYRLSLAGRGERGFTFTTEETRSLVLAGLRERGAWQQAHSTCAEALTRNAPADPRIGRFYLEAGQANAGGELVLAAARRYNTTGELGAALGELDRLEGALDGPPNHPLRLQGHLLRVAVLIERGDMASARSWAGHVAVHAAAAGHTDLALTASLREAQSAAYDGDSESALRIARSVAERTDAGEGNPGTRALAQRVLGLHLAQLGHLHEAEPRLQEALDLYTSLDDLVGQVNLLHHLAYLRLRQGNLSTAELHAQLGIELAESSGYGKALVHLVMCLGEVARARGDLDAAFSFYERARALQIQRGGRPYASSLNLAIVCLLQGEFAEAAVCAQEAAHVVRGSLAALAALLQMPETTLSGDDNQWDNLWAEVCTHSDLQALSEPDFAIVAEHVGVAAHRAGATSRALAVLRFSADIYERLGRPVDVRRVRALVTPPGHPS